MTIYLNTRIMSHPFTGVQRYTLEIIKGLGGCLTTVSPPPEKASGIKGQMWEQIVLPKIVKDNFLFSPNYSGPISLTKQIMTIHDLAPIDYPKNLRKRYVIWYRILIPTLASRCDGILTVSEFTKNKIINNLKIDEKKIKIIHNGVEDRFFKRKYESELIQKFFNLDIPPKYLLYVGSIQPRKNLKRLIQAWEKIESKIPNDVWLLLVGEKGKNNVFDDFRLRNLPSRVKHIGFVPDDILPLIYSHSIGFIFVSLYEGFGLPVLEAMASGSPVIASNNTALPEIVGDAGLLVNPLSIEEISASITSLIYDKNLRERLSEKGVIQATRFKWERTIKEISSFIQELWKIKCE